MADRKKGEALAEGVAEIVEAHNEIIDLLFKNGHNLSEGGKGLIAEIKRRGLKQKDAARILGITPAAVYNHWHGVADAA